MNRNQIYISTIAPDGAQLAREYGFGLEIAEYCTAWNMDVKFDITHPSVTKKLKNVDRCLLHAPFNELFPCAIDPKVRELAASRYRQALELAQNYGAKKVIIHGGYYEKLYYPVWYVGESVKFWQEFMADYSGSAVICLENVFEKTPDMLADIVRQVGDERLRICLDIGHVNAYSDIPLERWLSACAPYISHFHVHNNDGSADTHSSLTEGSMDMREFFARADILCPNATYTLELPDARSSCLWLSDCMSQN